MSNKKNKNNNAFTLVELIVVIVILAILATIAFLSFSSQSWSARDSTRLADISSIKKSVEMYNVNSWIYPTPDYSYSFTYSWGIIWNQWKIWDSAYKILQKNLSKKVLDPLKWSEYDYSLAANKREYQVAWNFENPTSFEKSYNPFDSDYNTQLSALGWTGANVYISWNYNWVMLKVFTWSTYYFVPTPTLFWLNSWTWNVIYDNTFWSGKDLLPWINNVAIFDSTKVYATGWTNLSSTDVSNLMITIKSAYLTWNITTPAVQAIITASWSELTDLGTGLIKNSLGGSTTSWWNWWIVVLTWAVLPWSWNTASWFTFIGATPASCADLLVWTTFKVGTTIPWNWTNFLSWTYLIDPDWAWAIPAKYAYCDMTNDWGGWTLLARWWVRDSRYCAADWFGLPSPANSFSVGKSYMPAVWSSNVYRTSYDWTTFSVSSPITNWSSSNWCMILIWSWLQYPPTTSWMYLFNWNWEWCHWFYYGWSCDSYTNNWWLYVK
ncbi:MAG: hypothetical protein ACD_3C00037G0028 [uncultured bacterium (gcode 4)]|uniref:Uncharacterized protein n=1 Tax=uncultured bacterium (gcode 4) TaxID=1234023 RepID=K2G309_9BACT|nr:MAG: hypothetical protein ACD_3C00037G0028 [uncultured bacterium (gcode 4)]